MNTVKSGISNLWSDLSNIEQLLAAILAVQAVIVNTAVSVGLPEHYVSAALGVVGVVSLFIQKVLEARSGK